MTARARRPTTVAAVGLWLLVVLVLADEACPPEAIRDLVVERAAGRTTRAYVVVPALGSRLDRLAGGGDAYTHASSHLESTLAALEPVTAARDGRIGSHDPVQAVDEGLREFRADEVVLVMHPDGSENWLETGIVETCRARYGIAVTPLVAQAGVTARRPPP